MCQWFGDDWDDIKERVYKQVNMTPVSFQDEVMLRQADLTDVRRQVMW